MASFVDIVIDYSYRSGYEYAETNLNYFCMGELILNDLILIDLRTDKIQNMGSVSFSDYLAGSSASTWSDRSQGN